MNDTPIDFLQWDSEFFGYRIARVRDHRLTPDMIPTLRTWCAAEQIACVYLLTDLDDPPTHHVAAQLGGVLTDVRVTFARNSAHAQTLDPAIRPCQPEDIMSLREIAAASYGDSRFYADPHFDRQRVDELYALWIERSCSGYAKQVFVAEANGAPSGFITCDVTDEGDGSIGLIGVAESQRGSGIGSRLIETALDWFATNGAARVSVVTQGRNLGAQRFYQRAGFTTSNMQAWYHWWLEQG